MLLGDRLSNPDEVGLSGKNGAGRDHHHLQHRNLSSLNKIHPTNITLQQLKQLLARGQTSCDGTATYSEHVYDAKLCSSKEVWKAGKEEQTEEGPSSHTFQAGQSNPNLKLILRPEAIQLAPSPHHGLCACFIPQQVAYSTNGFWSNTALTCCFPQDSITNSADGSDTHKTLMKT